MEGTTAPERIWNQMHLAYQRGCYYSDLSFKLKKKYMLLSFLTFSSPLAALAIYQSNIQITIKTWIITTEWIVSLLLLAVSLIEGYIAQTNLRGDISASRIMGVQFHKLTEKWRNLWIYQEREDIEEWVDHLDDLMNHMAVEHLSTSDKKLTKLCQEEAELEFADQFREASPETDDKTITETRNHQEERSGEQARP